MKNSLFINSKELLLYFFFLENLSLMNIGEWIYKILR